MMDRSIECAEFAAQPTTEVCSTEQGVRFSSGRGIHHEELAARQRRAGHRLCAVGQLHRRHLRTHSIGRHAVMATISPAHKELQIKRSRPRQAWVWRSGNAQC